MVGDLDRPPLFESNEQAAKRIPDAALIRALGADHLLPLRRPDLVVAQLRSLMPGS
jgi:pimeloyl-ACP methyl ester carboxylesterase